MRVIPIQGDELDLRPLGDAPRFGSNGEAPPLHTDFVTVSAQVLRDGENLSAIQLQERLTAALNQWKKNVEWVLGGILDIKHSDFIGYDNMRATPNLLSLASDMEKVDRWVKAQTRAKKPILLSSLSSLPGGLDEDYRRVCLEDINEPCEDIQRIVHRQRWERSDPVVQLSPGESTTVTTQLTSGISTESSQEFARTLGLSGHIGPAELRSELSKHLTSKVTISEQAQTTKSQQLTNNRDGYFRRVALWHVVQCVSVQTIAAIEPDPDTDINKIRRTPLRLRWEDESTIQFDDMEVTQTTACDVPM